MRGMRRVDFKSVLFFAVLVVAFLIWDQRRRDYFRPNWVGGVRHFYVKGRPLDVATTEYRLPAANVPEEHAKLLGPWLTQFVGVSTADANRLLWSRWANAPPALKPLCDRLHDYDAFSIVIHHDQPYLGIYRDNGGMDGYFVPPPLPDETVEQVASKFAESNESLRQFIKYFGGLRPLPPGMNAGFVYDEVESLHDDGHTRELDSTMILYRAHNGDRLVVREDGAIDWAVFYPEEKFKAYADTIPEFIERYAADTAELGLFTSETGRLDPYWYYRGHQY